MLVEAGGWRGGEGAGAQVIFHGKDRKTLGRHLFSDCMSPNTTSGEEVELGEVGGGV